MANPKIKQLPSGNYNAVVYAGKDANGKRKYKSLTAPTKREVKLMIAEFLTGREAERERANDPTLDEAIGVFIDQNKSLWKPSTTASYEKIHRNTSKELLSENISDLTEDVLQRCLNKDAKKLSPKTLRNMYGFYVTVIKSHNKHAVIELQYPAKKIYIREIPEPQEVYELVKGTSVELPVMLAMWLSLRMSEVLGLRHSDIQNGYATIRNTITYVNGEYVESESTKTTNSTRRLRVPPYLLQLIGEGNGHVVNMTANTITKRFSRMQASAGMKHIRFHDLRHINASVMVKLGVPDKYAMERGGWSSNAVMSTVYQHTFSNERQVVDDKIDAYFAEIISNAK